MRFFAVLLCAAALAFAQNQTAHEGNLVVGQNNTPNYTIVRGDNLWNLSDQFLGDPFLWGRIWDLNRYITDPYLIFPGDPLFIPGLSHSPQTAPLAVGVPAPPLEWPDPAPAPQTHVQTVAPTPTPLLVEPASSRIAIERRSLIDMFRYHISLEAQRQQAFVYEYERDRRGKSVAGRFSGTGAIRRYGGTVTHSGRQLVMQHQNVFVKIDLAENEAQNLIRVGERLGFYTLRDDLRNPHGVVVVPVANGLVRSLENGYATIFVDRLWGKLQEGAMLAPVRQHTAIGENLRYQTLFDSLAVNIFSRLNAGSPVRPFETAFIDRGAQSGVIVGDHIVFEDGLLEGLVVAVGETTATIRITNVTSLTSALSFRGARAGRVIASGGGL